ncbi:MAG TPA: restriction endonuclease [Gammaproteobacteria bacterium]|nr:restriction endonuclease [Gammaproteobacteria bacterium]
MARRKSGILNDLLEITSKLPWWVGVLLAVISYVALHQYSISEVSKISLQNHQFDGVRDQLLHTFAYFGQYLLPMIFLAGSILSAINTKRKQKLLDKQSGIDTIKAISWREFEELVGEYYRRNGYKVLETDSGPDGGVDIVVVREGKKKVVQCKHWKASKVGVAIVRELYGVMAAHDIAEGVVVTSGEFTKEARSFSESLPIELISGAQLVSIIDSVRRQKNVDTQDERSAEAVYCPRCNNPMVMRVAKKGSNMGQKFWGCSAFPRCKGTRDY